jgi:hypothetical protein
MFQKMFVVGMDQMDRDLFTVTAEGSDSVTDKFGRRGTASGPNTPLFQQVMK